MAMQPGPYDSNIPTSPNLLWSFMAGAFVGLFFGWLLGYLAVLPYLAGLPLFFIAGMGVGWLMTRVGQPAAPVRRPTVWLMGVGVALIIWSASLAIEYDEAANGVALEIESKLERDLDPVTEFPSLLHSSQDCLTQHWAANHPPGGIIGYFKWAVSDGVVACPRFVDPGTEQYEFPQRGYVFVVRVLLSLPLLAGGLISQLLNLRRSYMFYSGRHIPGPPTGW